MTNLVGGCVSMAWHLKTHTACASLPTNAYVCMLVTRTDWQEPMTFHPAPASCLLLADPQTPAQGQPDRQTLRRPRRASNHNIGGFTSGIGLGSRPGAALNRNTPTTQPGG